MDEIKYMDIKEFVDNGFLQEVNRKFFHPLGLALEVMIDGDKYKISGVWDYREDPEGMLYDLKNSSPERIANFLQKAKEVEKELQKHHRARVKLFGNTIVEPIPDMIPEM